MRASVAMEELQDETAPPVVAESMQPGGASLFKDMAACPFRAFAKHRLGAKPLQKADPGVSKKDQGNAVHKAHGSDLERARIAGQAPGAGAGGNSRADFA